MENQKSGFATASLVLGIIGVCTSFIPIINNLSFLMGILAVIFGIIAFTKKASKGIIIASIILGILAIVITLNSQKALSDSFNDISNELNQMSGGSTEEILANNVDIVLGNFEVIKGDFFDETKLSVKVTNKTSELKSFSILIEAVSSDGSRITTDYVYANSLNSGQSQTLDAFTLVSSEQINALKNATFKIVEVSMY